MGVWGIDGIPIIQNYGFTGWAVKNGYLKKQVLTKIRVCIHNSLVTKIVAYIHRYNNDK